MAINLYSKSSVDSLLTAKLSISSLSNAAATTLNATAPTTGQALTFDGTELVWATVGGGGGGVAWGAITGTLSDQTDLQNELNLKANLSAPSFTGGIVVDGGISCSGPSGPLSLSYAGITFADSTTQSTAATPYTTDQKKADLIISQIFALSTYSDSAAFNWTNPTKLVNDLGTNWGIYDSGASSYHYAAYAYANTVYFSGTWGGGPFYVRVNGTDSSFIIN